MKLQLLNLFLIFLIPFTINAKEPVEFNFGDYEVVKLTIPDQKFQKSYKHDCSILTMTDNLIVVKESVTSVYVSLEHITYIILHFYDRKSKKCTKRVTVYKAVKYSHDLAENKLVDFFQDTEPILFGLKDKVIVMSGNFSKEYSDNKKIVACKIVSFNLKQTNFDKVVNKVSAYKANPIQSLEVKLSSDSTFFMFKWKGFLDKKAQKRDETAIQIYDLNFKDIKLIPVRGNNDFTGFDNYLICLEPRKEPSTTVMVGRNYDLFLKVYDFVNDQSESKHIKDCYNYDDGAIGSNRLPAKIHVIDHTDKHVDIFILSPSETKFDHHKYRISTGSDNLDISDNLGMPVIKLVENENTAQTEFQNKFFKAVSTTNLDKEELVYEDGSLTQSFNSSCMSYQVVRFSSGISSRIAKSSPQLIWVKNLQTMVELQCVINIGGQDFQTHLRRPLIVDYTNEYITLLGNFSLPTITKTDVTMTASDPQSLQCIKIDVDLNEVYRENVTFPEDLDLPNYTYQVNPSSSVVQNGLVYCLRVNSKGVWEIGTIKVQKG